MNTPYPNLTDAEFARIASAEYQPPKASTGNGTCILIASVGEHIGLQDSKLPEAERRERTHVYTRAELAAFISSAKSGHYDHLI
jgi:hypothetical protein